MYQFRRCIFRKVLLTGFFFAAASFLYAQNGISIDKIRDDPYFMTGSAFSLDEEEDPSVIQADNSGKSAGTEKHPDEAGTFNDDEFPSIPAPDPVEKMPLLTDSQKFLEDGYDFRGAKFNVSAGWVFQYSPVFLPSCFAANFDSLYGFEFNGVNVKIDWLFISLERVKIGASAYLAGAKFYKKDESSETFARQYSADILITVKIFSETGNQFDVHVGGGLLEIENLRFYENNELVKGPSSWNSPDLRIGAGYEIFPFNHFGLRFGADFVWPFNFENYYPKLDFSLGLTARF